MAATWQIRKALDNDRNVVVKLWEEAGFGSTNADEWGAITSAGGPVELLVAEEDGRVIGTAVSSFDGWRAFVYHVVVAPAHQRQGVARALMSEAESLIKRHGARRAFALVNSEHTAGLALCAAAGFIPEGDMAFVKEFSK